MKKSYIAVSIFILMLLNMIVSVSVTAFDDVSDTDMPVTALAYMGIIEGNGDNLFNPDALITRAQFAKIISKATSGQTEFKNNTEFADVSSGDWYYEFVQDLVNKNLMKGISDNLFGPDKSITRQEALVIIHRLLVFRGMDIAEDKTVYLPDDEDLSEYAFEAVKKLVTIGILKYNEQTKIYPCEQITRYEACTHLFNALNYIESQLRPNEYTVDHKRPVPNDNITNNPPKVFDVSTMKKTVIGCEDFEDSDYGAFSKPYITSKVSYVTDDVYSGKNALKIDKIDSDPFQYIKIDYQLPPDSAGDHYAFSFMGKSISEHRISYCIEAYDKNKKHISGSYGQSPSVKKEWTEYVTQYQIPEGASYVTIQGYIQDNREGTILFDDFTLSKISPDPMETVLLTPAYKGLIYGDGHKNDINADVVINDYGVYDLGKFRLCAQLINDNGEILAKNVTDWCTGKIYVSFSSDKLPEGDYYLETILTDKETGEQIQKDSRTIRKRSENYRPDFYLDEYGRTVKDGKPFFFISFYDTDDFTDTLDPKVYKNFNVISQYSYNWWHFPKENRLYFDYFLDKLASTGLKQHVNIGNQIYYGQKSILGMEISGYEDHRNVVEGIAEHFKDKEWFFGYYVFDEKNPIIYGDGLRYNNEILSKSDIDHPSWGVTDFTTYPYGIFTKTCDILAVDPYPVYGTENDDIAELGRFVRTMRRDFPNRPVYAAIQAFDRGKLKAGTAKDKTAKRGPNEQEMRNLMWQAICEGAQGLVWFSLNSVKGDHGDSWRQYWNIVSDLAGEVKKCENIIMSADTKPYYKIKGNNEAFNMASRHYNGKSYVFAVNHTLEKQTINLYLDENVKSIKGLYSGETFKVNDKGCFKIDFDKAGVEIFEYEQSGDISSSEAELINFNLITPDDSLVFRNYSDEGEATYLLPSGTQRIRYSAAISDNACLYINGAECELTGELAVGEGAEITVKVVSENNKFTSEQKFRIKYEEGNY